MLLENVGEIAKRQIGTDRRDPDIGPARKSQPYIARAEKDIWSGLDLRLGRDGFLVPASCA